MAGFIFTKSEILIMESNISKFISQQNCTSICCVDEYSHPYCFSCFYSFDAHETLLFFKSSASAHHSGLLMNNRNIAGTILPDKLNALQIRGLQFEGEVLPSDHILSKNASVYFYKKHPLALTMPGEIWTIRIDKIKFTDNTLGFGKKLCWIRQEENTPVI
jgi:uncharacterized protein